jgi:hypothetical protein
MKYLLLLFAAFFITACGKTNVVEKPILVQKPELIVPELAPVRQYNFEWVIITKDNFADVMKNMESRGQNVVLFAVTPEGYQNLSLSVAELRKFIVQQQSIILSYKTYYKNEQ